MHHATPERSDALERLCHIAHPEVGQRGGVTWAAPPSVEAKQRVLRVRLPALAVRRVSRPQLDLEETRPESSGARGVIRGKLDQGER
jgi:hypothetical protein